MPRRASVRWDKSKGAWRTDAGGKTVYFRDVPRSDRRGADEALGRHLRTLGGVSRATAEVTVDELLVLYLTHATATVQARTVDGHREMLARFGTWPRADDPNRLGLRRARSIGADDLEGMEQAWARRGHAPAYRARLVASVKAAWRWGATRKVGLLPSNALAEVRPPRLPRAPERFAERAEVAAFLRWAWRRASRPQGDGVFRRFHRLFVLMVRVAAQTGARPGELVAAEWRDFDAAKRTLTLDPARHKTGGKTGQARTVYLTAPLVRALLRERARPHRNPTHVFVRRPRETATARRPAEPLQGMPWTARPLCQKVRKWRMEAVAEGARRAGAGERTWGLEAITNEGDNRFVMYRLRHSYISRGLMGGKSEAEVAAVCGTSAAMVAKVYGHIVEDHKRTVADDIGRMRGR
jgi:integrase